MVLHLQAKGLDLMAKFLGFIFTPLAILVVDLRRSGALLENLSLEVGDELNDLGDGIRRLGTRNLKGRGGQEHKEKQLHCRRRREEAARFRSACFALREGWVGP